MTTQAENERVESEAAAGGLGASDLKIILLGDSAVGKSKLVERFLMNEYQPRQLSTYALTLFRKDYTTENGRALKIDFWDTAGQERFNSMHPSYYYRAHACIMVFDVTRKATYQHLSDWYTELRSFCESIPVLVIANKIDVDYEVTKKSFQFPQKHNLPFFFVSAADGANVVRVFESAIKMALEYKESGTDDYMKEVLDLLDREMEQDEKEKAGKAKPNPLEDKN